MKLGLSYELVIGLWFTIFQLAYLTFTTMLLLMSCLVQDHFGKFAVMLSRSKAECSKITDQ